MGEVVGESRIGQLTELAYAYGPNLFPPLHETGNGLWRYEALLPLERGSVKYPLPVGGTPLLAPIRLRHRLDLPSLYLKDETRGPTGSNKDRATALVLEHGLRTGARVATAASTGNVAASLAIGAAAAGLRAVIFVPATVYDAKLALMLAAGATVFKVDDGYEAAFALSRSAAREFGWLDRNTGVNPLTLEAKKTVSFEIFEQLGRRIPDLVVSPLGDGPTLVALAKGFRELVHCGVADRVPRLIGVQSEGCQPLKLALETGAPARENEGQTIADGIAVKSPVAAEAVLRDVRETGGAIVAVSDQSMLQAMGSLAAESGLLAEPAAAAALAGLERLMDAQGVDRGDTVVVLVTGTALKTPQFLAPVGRVVHASTLSEVQRQV